jgi:tRNA/tmRNA/rRNA uracil-C5-methylase (TrmA/RlmC/RlmD family)
VELEVGQPVHGGHCLARLDGRVVFVRHALPGEKVRVRLTETGAKDFWRGDAVEVLEASADRVPSVWPAAGPGGVGGGELAHVALPAQRRWKAAVVADALRRIGALERAVDVAAAPGDDARGGLAWRTRVELTADASGRAGMFRYRSHDVVALADMPLAAPAISELGLLDKQWRPGCRIDAVAPAGGGRPLVLVDGQPMRGERRSVREEVTAAGLRHTYRVSGAGFWQVHDAAPQVLVEAVLAASDLRPGGRVLELYSGAGLFTLPLAARVGPGGTVDAVESDAVALRDARRNVHGLPQVVLHHGDVARVMAALASGPPWHTVVLDPPRAGAGRRVVAEICARAPERIVYVACDPAAMARDVRAAAEHGYELADLLAWDLFPHTHHVECVAVLRRA